MPVKNLSRIDAEGIYSHIYNKGIEARSIFVDEEDYKVFLGFLNDYLTAPKNPKDLKKSFQVGNRTFKGVPHQPKNYFKRVELIAYSLVPDCFHLILHQVIKGSLENFIRSLCTRYSIYFNKKYKHTGALFEGPYKSVHIEDGLSLPHLTRHLHHTGNYTSYPEYSGKRTTLWVKPEIALSFFKRGKDSYKYFMDKYEFDQKGKEIHHEEYLNPDFKSRSIIPEFLIISVLVFMILVTLGIRNINISLAASTNNSTVDTPLANSPPPSPAPAVLAAVKEATEEAKPKVILTVKIEDGSSSVNIRQKPTTGSEKIGQAKDGDTFELVSLDSGWHEVKLANGSVGFISSKYIVVDERNN